MYDDFLVDALSPEQETDTQRTIQDALKRAFAFKELASAKDFMLQRLMRSVGGTDANLERQKLELDVQMRKRSLGMLDTEDLDASMNSHKRGALAALGVHIGEAFPELPRASSGLAKGARAGLLAGKLNRFALGII
jgi:hypothetical protein